MGKVDRPLKMSAMLDSITNAPWQDGVDFLASGSPPMILRILALNTIFFILFLVRRMRGAPAMRPDTAIMVQSTLIASNMMVMFQDQIERLLKSVI